MLSNYPLRLITFLLLISSFFPQSFPERSLKAKPGTSVDSLHFCGSDRLHRLRYKKDPNYGTLQQQWEQAYQSHMQGSQRKGQKTAQYTLPVVVHIIHQNGVENISDAQIQMGLQHLNDAFANAGYYDQGTGVNIDIDFCLAVQDPDGNLTTGINRVNHPLTELNYISQDLNMKNLSRWEPHDYINIWVVREICSNNGCGVAGYAYLPGAHGTNVDGIVVEHEYFGGSEAQSSVLVHEMGHYLGLYHTFQGGCTNDNCLSDGDRVCDTPPDQSTGYVPCDQSMNSCFTDAQSGFPDDQPDMFWNYMDYSSLTCYSAFSQGQKDRMHFVVDQIRESLLQSKGCESPCLVNIQAAFTPGDTTIEVGQPLSFLNASQNATTYQWWVNGILESTSENFQWTFNDEGAFSVILEVENADPNCRDTDTVWVEVECGVDPAFEYTVDNLQLSAVPTGGNFLNSIWELRDNQGILLYTSTEDSITYFLPQSGWYELCHTVTGGFCSDTFCTDIFVSNSDDLGYQVVKYIGDSLDNTVENIVYHPSEKSFFIGGMISGIKDSARATLTKLNECSQTIWSQKYFGGLIEATITDISVMNDGNLLLAGRISNQVGLNCCKRQIILKVDATDGNILNSLSFEDGARLGGLGKLVASIGDPSGETYYHYCRYTQTPPTNDDFIISKLDGSGDLIWQKRFDDDNKDDEVNGILPLSNGRLLLFGIVDLQRNSSVLILNHLGEPSFSKGYSVPNTSAAVFRDIIPFQNGYLVSGSLRFIGSSEFDQFYGFLDQNWDLTSVQYIDSDYNTGYSWLEKDAYNQPYWIKRIEKSGLPLIHISKLNKDANIVWTKSLAIPTSEPITSYRMGITSMGTVDDKMLVWENTIDPLGLGGIDMCMGILDTSLNSCITSTENLNIQSLTNITDVPWSITEIPIAFNYSSINKSQSITYTEKEKCNPSLQCPEICNNGLDDDGDGLVDQLDEDCDCQEDPMYFIGDSTSSEMANVIIPSKFGGFYLGGSRGDSALIIKTNDEFQIEWSKVFQITNTNDQLRYIVETNDNQLIISGRGLSDNGASYRHFIFKYNLLLKQIDWSWTYIGDINDLIAFNYLFVDPNSDDIMAVGQTRGNPSGGTCDGMWVRIDNDSGELLNLKHFHDQGCDFFNQGASISDGVLATGRNATNGSSSLFFRPVLTKFDLNGDVVWSHTYLLPSNNIGRLTGRAIDVKNDRVIIGGSGDFNGNSNIDRQLFLIETDLDGIPIWEKRYDLIGWQNERIWTVNTLSDGYVVTGIGEKNSSGINQIFLLRTDTMGEILQVIYLSAEDDDRLWDHSTHIFNNEFILTGSKSRNGDYDIPLFRMNFNPTFNNLCLEFDTLQYTSETIGSPYFEMRSINQLTNPFPMDTALKMEWVSNVTYNTTCDSNICQEICNNGLDDDGDGLVDCFDEECFCDTVCEDFYYGLCDTFCVQHSFDSSFSLKQKWSNDGEYCVYSVPKVGDIDGDGSPEVIINQFDTNNDALHVLDGVTGDVKMKIPIGTSGDNRFSSTAIGDIDVNDGGLAEILFSNRSKRIFCFDHDGTLKWQSSPFSLPGASSQIPQVNIADFNLDGLPEVYFNATILNGQDGSLLGAGSGAIGASPSQVISLGFSVAMDVLPDPACPTCNGMELIAGNTVYSVEINLNTNQATVSPEVVLPGQQDGLTAIADWDLDGDLDGIITRRNNLNQVRLYVWDLQSPTLLGSIDFTVPGANAVGNPQVSDIDGDGWVEAVFSSNFKLFAIDNDFSLLWSKNVQDESGLTGISSFDFNNDQKTELVFRDEENLQILDGATGMTITSQTCYSPTGNEYPVIADVDADGNTEILSVCSDVPYVTPGAPDQFRGQLIAFESGNKPWVDSRSIWNQYAYFNTNINNDLSIPIEIQQPQLVPNAANLNAFLRQYAHPLTPLPDASLDSLSIQCTPEDSLDLSLFICNRGDNTLSQETPITIYEGNPLQTAASAVVTGLTIGQNLNIDSCRQLSFTLPELPAGSYYVVVNDDASLTPPFSLTEDFPVTAIAECDYTNNLDSFIILPLSDSLNLGPDTTICDNGVVQLQAGTGFNSYRWQDGSTDSTYTVFESGLFWVEVTNDCDTLRDSIRITVDSATILNLGPDTLLCNTGPLSFDRPPVFTNWLWSPNLLIDCDTCATVTLTPSPTQTVTYIVAAQTGTGCYSIDTLQITSAATAFTTIDTSICEGDSVVLGDVYFTQSGTYMDTFASASGCDSMVQLNVLVYPVYADTLLDSSCNPQDTGLSLQTYTSVNGCDSLVYTRTTLLPTDTFFSITYTCNPADSGLMVEVFTNQFGCDSIVISGVQYIPPDTTRLTLSSCFPQDTGTVVQSLTNSFGCDSTVITTTLLLPSQAIFLTDGSCHPQDTGIFVDSLTNQSGCDSIVTTQVMLFPKDSTFLPLTSCNPADTGLVIDSLLNQFGCDSIVYRRTSLLPSQYQVLDTLLCENETLTVEGFVLQAGDTSVFNYINQQGCDSIIEWQTGIRDTFLQKDTLTICTGDSVLIFGSWEKQTGTFSQTYLAANQCDSMVVIELIVSPAPIHTLLTSAACFGEDSGTIEATPEQGTPPYTYEWGHTSANTNALQGLGADDYFLTITDALGCTIRDTVAIAQQSAPDFTLQIEEIACFGDATGQIELLSQQPLLWSFDGGPFVTPSPVGNLPAGSYPVSIQDTAGCTLDTLAEINSPPEWNLLVLPDSVLTLNFGEGVDLQAITGAPSPLYSWQPPSAVDCEDCPQVLAQPDSSLQLLLEVTDSAGCKDTVWIRLNVEINCGEENIAMPNVFTPNGDGQNDLFAPVEVNEAVQAYELIIFDRWGEKILERKAPEILQWDGTFQGKPMPAEVYVYMIRYRCVDGSEGLKYGDVTLVR